MAAGPFGGPPFFAPQARLIANLSLVYSGCQDLSRERQIVITLKLLKLCQKSI